MKILVNCMHGIGDTIYSRPFVKMLVEDGHEVFLKTPLPFIYGDLDVKFVKTKTKLRTQKKHLEQSEYIFVDAPIQIDKTIDFFYNNTELKSHGIVAHMEQAFGYECGSTTPIFDLPSLPLHGVIIPENKKLAIVRPVTYRKEWFCTSRSPQPNYITWCARILKDMGYYVISIADCEADFEWIVKGGDPIADQKFHKGELGLERTLSLMQSADLVVGGSGFIVPATIAAHTNLFIIFGGRGAYDNPQQILDLRMNLKKVGWSLPDNFCRCHSMNYPCNKEIRNLDSDFFRFVSTI